MSKYSKIYFLNLCYHMPYGNKKLYKKTTKKYVKKSTKRKPMASKSTVKTIVKREIARNVENKIANNVQSSQSLLSVIQSTGVVTYLYYTHVPYNANLFAIAQGTSMNQRIGNQIKMKRWVMKGSLYYDPNNGDGTPFNDANGMYVDLYFGRKLDLQDSVDQTLAGLYQNGNATVTPTGQIFERLYSVNRDLYKIYWHKRYKIGTADAFANNDYKLNREFGFDICKLVCKNKILKYNDDATQPSDALIESLTMFATCTLPCQDLAAPSVDGTTFSPVRIQTNSYFEYEDA